MLFPAGASLSPQCLLGVEAHKSEGSAFREVIPGRRLAVALMSQLTRAKEARFGFPAGASLSPQCSLGVAAKEGKGSAFRFPGRRLAFAAVPLGC